MSNPISPKISDQDLVTYLQEESTAQEAFGILLDRYSAKLYVTIRRIVHTHEDADDVLQNTFIKVWKNIHTFRGDSRLYTWLYSIASNEALSHLRRERRDRKVPLKTDAYDLSETLSGDPFFNGSKAEALLAKAVEQLPDKQKLVFRMRYFDELPYNEISEITNTSVGALKASYHHAVKKLEKYLHLDD